MGGPGAGVLLRQALTQRQEEKLEIWLRTITRRMEKPNWARANDTQAREFWFNEDTFPGKVSGCVFNLLIETTLGEQRWDEDEKRQVEAQLGYLPEQAILVSSGCNQREDHTTLGQFVLHLARMYDGLIDMNGAITPPLRPLGEEGYQQIRALLATAPERRKEHKAYLNPRLDALKASLPPGKAWLDLVREQFFDPDSPLRAILNEASATFGLVLPPGLSHAEREASREEISAYVMAFPGKIYEIEYTVTPDRRWVSHIVDVTFLEAWLQHSDFYMVK